MKDEWKKVHKVARYLKQKLGSPPDVLMILGSGLQNVASGMDNERTLSFADIPFWPKSTVKGHPGSLRRGTLAETEVVLQLGRVHLYEGYSSKQVVLPIRAAIEWGVNTVIITNAAGGINPHFKPGTLMIIEDHINLTGRNPLMGPNNDQKGPRFPDMSRIYSPSLRARALDIAPRLNISLKTGIYAGMLGPSYETPAEINMLRVLNADAVGMSTVLEAIAASHMGAEVGAVSCITNMAASTAGSALSHEDVKIFAAKSSLEMTKLLVGMLETMR
jgi:purine-nucleoside phosphorylase